MTTTTSPPTEQVSGLDRYFRISERGSNVRREVRGGLVTFVTMAYIVVLNPLIIGTVKDADGKLLGITAVAGVTALVAAVMTILMGVVGRYPLAVATGLGLNAFVAFGVASRMSWADAMGLVVLEGLVITLLVLTGFRTAVLRAIPNQLKTAIAVGIGLFIALIGFVDAGFVRKTSSGSVPVQLSIAGDGSLRGWPTLVFVVGVVLITVLLVRGVRGAILIGIAVATALALIIEKVAHPGASVGADGKVNPEGWQLNVPTWPGKVVDTPDLSLVGHFSLTGGFSRIGVISAVLIVFTLMLADFFDTMGTVVGVGAEAGLLDEEGHLPGVEQVLLIDSLAAAAGGAASAASATTYVESASGVGDGARTGLASVVTGLLFILALFFTPLVSLVPSEAAAPALVVVGVLLFTQVRSLDLTDLTLAVPAFLTIVVMPFTYSITDGIGAGFISYTVLMAAKGKVRDVHPLLWVITVLYAIYFMLDPLKTLLGIN